MSARRAPRRAVAAASGLGAFPRQSEASWQATVLEYATVRGWHHWRDTATNAPRRCGSCGQVRRGPRNASGHPDLLLIRRPRLVWVELKAEDGKLSEAQQTWIEELQACGQEVYIWKPSDWDEVAGILR